MCSADEALVLCRRLNLHYRGERKKSFLLGSSERGKTVLVPFITIILTFWTIVVCFMVSSLYDHAVYITNEEYKLRYYNRPQLKSSQLWRDLVYTMSYWGNPNLVTLISSHLYRRDLMILGWSTNLQYIMAWKCMTH